LITILLRIAITYFHEIVMFTRLILRDLGYPYLISLIAMKFGAMANIGRFEPRDYF